MGSHFVPQAHLRAFQDPTNPGFIWTYPRGEPARLASIAKVAQTAGFYDPDVERDLNRLVETPANPLFDKLRQGQLVDATGKHAIALYLATMLKRGPRGRQRGRDLVPDALSATISDLKAELETIAADDPDRLATWLTQLDALHTKYRNNPPSAVLAELRSPWPSQAMVDALRNMRWRVLVTAPPEMFITSDNPAFFFEAYGLANPEAELCFPLSPTHCLHCSNQSVVSPELHFIPADRNITREMNRRVASGATKLVLAHRKLAWPAKLLLKPGHYLSRIKWSS